jgi:hypothetical protein
LRIGKIEEKSRTPSGISVSGMKTPERKYRGRTATFVIAGAASSEGMRAVSANPRHENEAAPTRIATKSAGAVEVGTSTS